MTGSPTGSPHRFLRMSPDNERKAATSDSKSGVPPCHACPVYRAAKRFIDSEAFQGVCDEEVLLEQALNKEAK